MHCLGCGVPFRNGGMLLFSAAGTFIFTFTFVVSASVSASSEDPSQESSLVLSPAEPIWYRRYLNVPAAL